MSVKDMVSDHIFYQQDSVVDLMLEFGMLEEESAENYFQPMDEEDIIECNIHLWEEWQENEDNLQEEYEDFADFVCDYSGTWQAQPEIFEWWLISRELAYRLAQKGETIYNPPSGSWWGRKETGGAISIDSVINEIHDEWPAYSKPKVLRLNPDTMQVVTGSFDYAQAEKDRAQLLAVPKALEVVKNTPRVLITVEGGVASYKILKGEVDVQLIDFDVADDMDATICPTCLRPMWDHDVDTGNCPE